MPQLRRPQTSREAKAAYNKRCAKGYMSKAERERLAREEKREERRLEALRKEAARKEAAKRRAEKEARQREERKRLGIPEPGYKVSHGQLRIGEFLKGPAQVAEGYEEEPPAAEMQPCGGDGDCMAEGNPVDSRQNQDLGTSASQRRLKNHADAIENADARPPNLEEGKLSSPILPPADFNSSCFVSNSQIDRELNHVEPTHLTEVEPQDACRSSTQLSVGPRKVNSSTGQIPAFGELDQLPVLGSPSRSEIQTLLNAIPSSELDCI